MQSITPTLFKVTVVTTETGVHKAYHVCLAGPLRKMSARLQIPRNFTAVTLTPKSVRVQKTFEKISFQKERFGEYLQSDTERGLLWWGGDGPWAPAQHPGLTSRSAPPPSWSLPWRWLSHEVQGFCLNSLRVSLPESQL